MPPTRAGPGAATIAAPGTAWSRRRRRARRRPPAARRSGRRLELVPLAGADHRRRRDCPAASTSSTASWAAASWPGAAHPDRRRPRHRQEHADAAGGGRPGRSRAATVVYVSGEESIDQIRLRAAPAGPRATRRSSWPAPPRPATCWPRSTGPQAPDLVIVDSIQTMWVDGLEQAPGTVTQLRAAAQALIRFAKQRGSALLLIGHVTKDGQIAGPRVLEHMVDAVLYFEGERGHQFRILRAVKNRFGPANEIGVFEMAEAGLVPVPNPSALFLADREEGVAGSAVFAGMEGTPPAPGRDPGPGRTQRPRHAAPRRRRLGRQPAGHAAGRARGALRPCDEHARRLSQRRRWACGCRSRRPTWRWRRRSSPPSSAIRRRPRPCSSARSGSPARCVPWAMARRGSRKRRSWASRGRSCRAPARIGPAGLAARRAGPAGRSGAAAGRRRRRCRAPAG